MTQPGCERWRRAKRVSRFFAVLLLVTLAPALAWADDEPPKREVPDYDGRGDEPATAGDAALWVPRILMAPLWVVSEYVLRLPFALLVTALDKAGLQEWLGEESDYLLFPTLVVDFGFRPSIGLYSGVNDLWFKGHQLRARVAFGGAGFWKAKIKDRVVFDGGRQRIGIWGVYRDRPDDTFGGIGSDVEYDLSDAGRFSTRTIEGGARYDYGLSRPTELTLNASVRDVTFQPGACCGPTLVNQIARGEIEAPPGFEEGYLTFHPTLGAALDTRSSLLDRDPWLRAELTLEGDVSLERPDELRWVNYGAEVGGGVELGWPLRRLSASMAAMFADPTADDPVPFNSLARLGGNHYLRGFGGDALYGRSAVVATLVYKWPVWVTLDGAFHIAAGNVFNEHLENFEPDKLRLSFGPSIGSNYIDEDSLIDLAVAFGTETFEQGTRITNVRLAFGITDGF